MKRKKGWMRSVKAVCAAAMAISLALGNVSPALAAGQDAKPAVTEKAGREALPGNGMMLDSSWIVDNPSEGKLKVNEDGSVTITTEGGEWGGMKNVLRQKVANKADFVLTVKVRGLVEKDFQGAYLMASSGPGQANAVAAVRRYHSFLGGGYGANELVGMMSNGGSTAEFYTAEQGREDEVYLRLKKSGSSFSSYYSKSYSATDEGWTLIQDGKNSSINAITQGNLAGTEEIYIGFTANSGGQNNGMDITFSDFRFDGEEIPLGVNLSSLSSVELTCSDKIAAGGTASLTMKALDGNGDEIAKEELTSVVYSSDDEEIATVDQKGVVTGVKAGKTVIRCEVTAGNIVRTASLEVQVGEIVVEKSWTTTSPDGKTVLEVELMTGGALQYRAKQDGKVTMETSPIGIVTNLGDFSKKLAYKSETSEEEINETYPMISGKKKIYTNHCKQRTVTFTLEGKPGVEFDFITRAYDDGTAFRYAIRGQENEALSISSETTAFQLPAEAEVYYMPHGSGQWTYEGYYEKATAETLEEGAIPSIPLLYKTKDGVWNLLTEAALNGSYTGSMTRVEKGGLLRLAFDPIQSKDVQTTAPFLSPWRTIITGTPEDIVQNTMTENLSPERLEGYDFENWVDPGLSSWSWVTYYGGQENEETHKKFIDLAADLGWKYYILDEGWQPQTTNGDGTRYTGYREWFYRVRDYANEKGVKLIAWVDSKDISQKEHRESRLDQWAKDGIVGIKTDFFNHESQSVLQVYDELYKYCAQKHLMVNIHGGNKATGEVRTYPNVLAREGIAGQEQGGITAEQYTLIPFIRAAVGPADVTEQLFSRDVNKTTMGFQIALTALVEDGIHSMGDSVENYYKVAPAISYYKNYPSSWDDLKYLDSVPGDYVNLARKAGDSWYVSGISTKEKNMEIVLDFLESGTDYTAVIYKENGRSDLVMEVQEAASTDTLSIPVLKGGGYAVKLIPKEQLDVVTSITTDKTEITLEKNRTYQAKATPFPADAQYQEVVWSSANEEIAKVNSSGLITGLADGETTITVSSAFDANVKAEIKVKVIPERYALDTERWEIISENEKRFLNSETSVSIVTENGGIGGKNLFAMKVPEGKKDFTLTAKVSGGLSANYQGAFIAVFDKDDIGNNYVSAGRRYHNYLFPNSPKRFGMMSGGGSIGEFYGEDGNPDAEAYIKLVKEGNKFTGYYSFDNEEWTQIVQNESGKNAESVTSDKLANCENLYVGFYASSGGANNELVITFEDFTFDGQVIPVAVDTRPEEPELPATPESVAELADAVAQVENKYQETDYTEEDWKTFTDALKEAKQVIGNEEATQKQVDDAKKKLDAAVNLLE
ncbi:glycoside hydrolase family 97 N-terminal domain-containing protein, partial [Lachnospiraceae bacterium 45-W7]